MVAPGTDCISATRRPVCPAKIKIIRTVVLVIEQGPVFHAVLVETYLFSCVLIRAFLYAIMFNLVRNPS